MVKRPTIRQALDLTVGLLFQCYHLYSIHFIKMKMYLSAQLMLQKEQIPFQYIKN